MSTSEYAVLSRMGSFLGNAAADHRPIAIQLLEHLVNYLEQSIEKQNALIALRQAADERADAAEKDRDAEKDRADKAEKSLADLEAQVAADEATLKAQNDKLDTEIAEEEPAPATITSGSGVDTVIGGQTSDLVHADPTLAQ